MEEKNEEVKPSTINYSVENFKSISKFTFTDNVTNKKYKLMIYEVTEESSEVQQK